MSGPQPTREMVLPPWLIAGVAPEGLREGFSRARWMLGAYWLLTLTGFAVLSLVATLYWRSANAGIGMVVLSAVSALGVALGNLLGLLRTRAWVIQTVILGATIGTCVSSVALGPVVVLYGLMFLWSVGCGHLTLQRRFSLATLWIPVICWTGAILTILDRAGRMHAWQGGHKEGVWQPVTLALLLLLVMMFFLFLAAQEHYHTLVWQASASSTPASLARHRVKGAMRLTGRGMAAIVALAVLVGGSVALVSPYLWRTGPARRDGERARDAPRERRRDEGPPRDAPDWDGDALSRAIRRMAREAEEQSKSALPFVPLFLLRRPMRRWWLMRRLRRRGAPPSTRAAGLWRYLVIGLDDARLGPRGGETLEDMVVRVNAARAREGYAPVPGLAESVVVYERVRYGLGIPQGAVDALQTDVERAFDEVRRPLDPWTRLKGWFRKLD